MFVLMLRRTEQILHPVFFCEDSTVFYKGARELGVQAFFQTSAGYYHAVPRIVAFFGNWMPAAWVPRWYLAAAMTVVVAGLWKIANARWDFRYAPAMALAVAVVPHTSEVYLCLVNVQWTLALILVVLALQKPPESQREAVGDFTWLVVTGLTGPFIIFFWPLFLWRLVCRGRISYDVPLFAVSTGLAAIQGWAVIQSQTPGPEYIDVYGLRGVVSERLINGLFGISFTGITAKDPACWFIAAFLVAVTAGLVVTARSKWSSQQRKSTAGIVVAITLIAATVLYKFASMTYLLTDKITEANGDRYFFIPHVLMLWFLIACWELEGNAGKWARILCLWSAIAAIPSTAFRNPLYEDAWKWKTAEVDQGKYVVIEVNPGWTLEVNRPKDMKRDDSTKNRDYGNAQ